MDVPYIINLKTQNSSTSTTSNNELFKKINTFNLTGINEYKNKGRNYNSSSNYSNLKIKNSLPSSYNEDLSQSEKEEKLSFIKNLIKMPKEKPYDGYACFRKKPTINYLLKRFEIKEKRVILEENKLCKIPYPLIKFISNRKSPNKSKELMNDILSAELNNLSAQQKNDIKYKKYRQPIKINKIKCPKISNSLNYFRKIQNYSERKSYNNKKYLEFPFIEKYIAKKDSKKDNIIDASFNRDNYSCLTTNKPCCNNRSIKNILRKSYCRDDINLTEHSTLKSNISILKNDVAKKLQYKNENFNDILKDISLLKSNNHIMAFN